MTSTLSEARAEPRGEAARLFSSSARPIARSMALAMATLVSSRV